MTTPTNNQSTDLDKLRALIANDGYAMSFQSLGQYRTALLKAIDVQRAEKGQNNG